MPIPPPRSNGMPPASLKPDSSAIFLLENGENGTKTKMNGKNADGDSGGSEIEESAAKLPRRSTKEWLSKYFWEGQKLQGLEETGEKFQLPPDATFEQKLLTKYRNWIALLIPVSIVQFMWWTSAIKFNWFSLYETHYQMPLTMILGSIIAGMTSEGGGAVAFPVMTFILHIKPHVARDFSIMVQAVGMSMALFVILFMRIQIEWRAIIFGTFGAIPGALLGFTFLEPLFTPRAEKMLFVSIWSSFAISLWILNREKKRKTFTSIQQFNVWKSAVLILTGFIGGIFTSFAGSGVDICTFSTLTLLFSVSEKIATPTTVVIMAINSQFCYYWRSVMMNDGISELAYNYIKVTIPVTSFAAPFGSFLGSHFHRQTLAYLVYILELISYIAFLFTAPPLQLIVASILIIASGFAFFRLMGKWGKKLMLIAAAREELGIVGNGSPKKLLLAKKASVENVDF